jgi:hypothetical protein
MSSRPYFLPVLFLFLLATAAPVTEIKNGDSSFQGNRRPGILEEPSEVPIGENSLLYRRIGKLKPNELLDFVTEESAEEK